MPANAMDGHGIPSDSAWTASPRYSNKTVSKDGLKDFCIGEGDEFKTANSHPDSQMPASQSPASSVSSSQQAGPSSSSRLSIRPRGGHRGRFPKSRARSARQSYSPRTVPASDPSASSPSEPLQGADLVKENEFCDLCQVLISSSKTIQMRPEPREGEDEGIVISVEKPYKVAFSEEPSHYDSLEKLHRSAENGCHLCSLLAALSPTALDVSPGSRAKTYQLRLKHVQSYDGPGHISMMVQGHGVKSMELSYGAPSSLTIQDSLRYRRTDTDQVFTLAKRWLGTCLGDHARCGHSSRSNNFLPSRLLKVTASGLVLRSIQLCLTTDEVFPPRTPYLALSHCWGKTKFVELTTSTHSAFLTSIPLSSLPPTFSDAAIITTRLGYTYLWIDALCIIQDSPDDWVHEAATMGDVYTSAACAISALGASDSRGGCFVTRNPLAVIPCALRNDHNRDSVWADNRRIRRSDSARDLCPPLHRRAWVVQERTLAPRTLHFGSEMIFWECVQGRASETEPWKGQRELEPSVSNPDLLGDVSLKMALHATKEQCRHGHDWEVWRWPWWMMVQAYTACKLTFDKDKWAAFAGLAGEVERHTRTRLHHGLWESNLFDEVLWKAKRPGRKVDYDAPSWSWLSVDAGVSAQRYNFDLDFRRVATVSIPSLENMSTEVSHRSRQLSVRGRLLGLTSRIVHLGSGEKRYRFRLQDGRDMHELDSDGLWSPDVPPDTRWELSILQFVTTTYKESFGLVVRPADASRKVWLRVGFYGFRWYDERNGFEFGNVETVMLV